MNQVSREFLELAKRSAAEYVVNENVLAIVVAGSVARGTADRNSDVDILVFLEKPVSQRKFDAECRRAEQSAGRLYGGSPDKGFALYRFVEGVRCDFVFDLTSTMEMRLTQVLEEFCIDEHKQLMIRSVRESELLYGQQLINSWRRRSDHFPDGLVEAIITEYLPVVPRWVLEKMGAERGERLFLYDSFMFNVKRLFAVMFGLNRTFHPAKLKGIKRVAATLPIAPPDFYRRTEMLFEKPLDEAVADFSTLVDEVYDLVEANAISIDVGRARRLFNMKLTVK